MAVCLALLAASVSRAAGTATGLLLVSYTTPTTLQVTLGDGTPVRAGSVVPAGVYNVQVKNDPNAGDPSPAFIVSGPGVSVSSDLNSTGMGLDGLSVFGPITLQASSSYRIGDSSLPSSIVTFTTSATASGSTGTTTTPGTVTTTPSGTGASPMPATSPVATLTATIAAGGKVTLTMTGRAVKSLRAGRYKLVVTNRAGKGGLLLWHGTKRVLSLTRGQKTVMLSAGKWSYAASASGRRTPLAVTG